MGSAIAFGALVAGFVTAWHLKRTSYSYQEWRVREAQRKSTRKVFLGHLPQAAAAVVVLILLMRLLF